MRRWNQSMLYQELEFKCAILSDGVRLSNTWSWGYNPEWSIRPDGIYRWTGKTLGWFGKGEWRKETDVYTDFW
ncbi:hypothetical protein FRX31_018865 [Thalictrum thalictroides]|uniref:Uncharacterized protein n=1 Tax=Thalictrum thalictroides TaxID=46969 RepID=A0A7J6W2F3_THATH|nr:hypothetical protein FRX31_018865 [Thalictrum thalictroides]